jgi:hypothetical protein
LDLNEKMNNTRINEIDNALLVFNNQISLLEYRETKENVDLSSEIQQVCQCIESLLSSVDDEELESANSGDLITKKKMQILKDLILFSRIENHQDILAIRNQAKTELRKLNYMDTLHVLMKNPDREQRKNATDQVAGLCQKNDTLLVEFIQIHNKIAQLYGFKDFAQAKLESEGLSDEIFVNYYQNLKKKLSPQTFSGKDPSDLYYQLGSIKSSLQIPDFDSQQLLTNLFSDLGLSLENLPIRIEWEDLDFSGACFRVSVGKDIRLIVNKSLTGLSFLHYLLHEVGHAVYYCFCPMNSELLIDTHISREIMADIWTQFLKDKTFLQKYLGMDSESIQKYLTMSAENEHLSQLIQIRDSMFIYEAFKNPTTSLPQIWQKISKEWLDVDDDSGAFDVFDFFNPLDSKSYVFAADLSHKFFNKVTNDGINSFLSPALINTLIKDLYAPGSLTNWTEKFDVT